MIYAQGEFLCGDIVSERQIQFKGILHLPGNGSDRIMGLPVGFCVDKGFLVGIASPCVQDMLCQVNQAFLVLVADTDDGQRPFYNACLHILKSRDREMLLDGRLCHGKGIVASLIVVMA